MQMASCLILLCLFVFVQGDPADVYLRCNETAGVQSGQNLTIHCEIDSRGHQSKPCEAKDIHCECSSQLFVSCDLKKEGIQLYSVKFSNVTVTGTYTMTLATTCGIDVNDSIKIKVTDVPRVAEFIAPTPPESPESKLNIGMAVGCVAAALVAIIALILGIRKY